MTHEEIIRMAREAVRLPEPQTPQEEAIERALAPIFERFAAIVAAAEREACAALLDAAVENFTSISLQVNDEDGIVMEHANTCSHLAAAIRARK
jgi:hypothetical protein